MQGASPVCARTGSHPPPSPSSRSRPQIKSTTLDAWQSDWVNLIARVGNVRFNAVYEAKLTDRCV